jgi:hypothetical protein
VPNTIWLAGQRITADALNDMFLSGVQVLNSAFSLASSASVYTAISFSSILGASDTSMWSISNPTRLVAPHAGTFNIHGHVVWPGTLAAADGRAELRISGSGTAAPGARLNITRGSAGNAAAALSGQVIFTAAGQYVELVANQNSGVSTSLIASLGMTRAHYSTS